MIPGAKNFQTIHNLFNFMVHYLPASVVRYENSFKFIKILNLMILKTLSLF
jgi:hypothetical protein